MTSWTFLLYYFHSLKIHSQVHIHSEYEEIHQNLSDKERQGFFKTGWNLGDTSPPQAAPTNSLWPISKTSHEIRSNLTGESTASPAWLHSALQGACEAELPSSGSLECQASQEAGTCWTSRQCAPRTHAPPAQCSLHNLNRTFFSIQKIRAKICPHF